MKTSLLDTNVLLALAWPNHQHHAQAHRWFAEEAKKSWATCSLTQLGFVRLSSNPAYTPNAAAPLDAAGLLLQWTKLKGHHFWASPEADDQRIYQRALGHKQVNDAWLVQVARRNSGRIATLDQQLAVHDATGGLVEVIKT